MELLEGLGRYSQVGPIALSVLLVSFSSVNSNAVAHAAREKDPKPCCIMVLLL